MGGATIPFAPAVASVGLKARSHMHALAAILVSGSILSPVLPVDFRILPSQGREAVAASASPAPPPIGREPLQVPAEPPSPAGQAAPPARRAARPLAPYPAAQGFGNDVPLRFAARQIVPEGISVVFADGIDSGVRVSWQGGAPWNRTLQSAIQPLGLRVHYRDRAITISR
ncbi:hypothetical protein [Plastoroseomonas hellenica]|uniref:hypothetical protein n=1 Tax=Plastoroseomonas hellenica TaxID=2687306 RepID=UPI002013BA3B|nr:hypothetical protein [Plastoroseomonas hellenica]